MDRHAVFKHTPSAETAAAPTQFSRAIGELGLQLIFAQSSQAKGIVERTAGTFQDRLVSELRLAGAATIDDANRVLEGFLTRFNNRFKVPPQESEVSYRAVDEGMCLENTLCSRVQAKSRQGQHGQIPLAHPVNCCPTRTGRPTPERPWMCSKGWTIAWRCSTRGRDIPSQEAPPRPSVLRGFAGRTAHSPIIQQPTNGLGSKWAARLATQDANHDAEQGRHHRGHNRTARVRKAVGRRRRKPTPLQTARWRAVQKAKCKGLSIRGVAQELGIHRDTAKKYMNADRPPTSPGRLTAKVS